MRYANPAWEALTGKSFAALRGTRISAKRESASPLWKALAPPLEVWNGSAIQVRRACPDAEYGPPWWDISFAPLAQPHGNAIIGFLTQVGETPEKHTFREPAALAIARAEHAKQYTIELFAGTSPVMQRLRDLLRTAALVHAPVWIHGGPGSGRETAARVIHHLGLGKEKAFVALDCKGLQPYLIEQLAFGRGGFASSKVAGSLLLKSPELLPRELQSRFIEWSMRPGAPRFFVSSVCTASQLFQVHRIVPEMYAQLDTISLSIPLLRFRLDELTRIVERFGFGDCDENLWPALRAHDWLGGNIRELHIAMKQGAKIAEKVAGVGAKITEEHLPLFLRERLLLADTPPMDFYPLAQVLEKVERETIEAVLRLSGSNLKLAAERVGMPKAKLVKRMKALGIET